MIKTRKKNSLHIIMPKYYDCFISWYFLICCYCCWIYTVL